MTDSRGKPYRFSEHARERFAVRASLTEQDLLKLLELGAFRCVHTKLEANISQHDIDLFMSTYGMSFSEMKQYGIVRIKETFRHVLIWSCPDQRPLTLVVAADDVPMHAL